MTRVRARNVRAWLVAEGHRVTHGQPGVAAPSGIDVWLHGMGYNGDLDMVPELVEQLFACRAPIALFQLCDAENIDPGEGLAADQPREWSYEPVLDDPSIPDPVMA